ncbi:alternative ribosome rescue aminoacyl-tRNA hydrolase ArfB [Sphingomicrobium astaxanthinifaciens]|uniref:alternative ribosome rescue aminoacyl-tRNA hydrolase ArfB n=1 Tax=Sphingomicrobium astaxanthinifaciens TaxID=1227949 RepID=UPI001FCC5D9C|nr:alternative ribosome rescue aminoacyl-tRNA hydrolase ArfB [Sphingomicrobium astaxanthinifaciens]MCJ7421696.1 aminoacyl-tRNA hydrolase [Sphingomicrobium astaxanthinifaciens]
MKPEDVALPEEALEESYLAASGPGGQHANTTETGVQLRVDLMALGLSGRVLNRLRHLGGSKVTKDRAAMVITAKGSRSREDNRREARARLAEMIAKAHVVPRKRRKTKPSRAAKARRTDAKVQRGKVKKMRGKVDY